MTAIHRPPLAPTAALIVATLLLVPGRATAQQGWTGVVQGLSFSGTTSESARVATDPAGNAIAVWERYDDSSNTIATLRYVAAAGNWPMVPLDLSPSGQIAFAPRVAIDGAGNAIVIWIRYADPIFYVQSRRYTAATGVWSPPTDIATVGTGGLGPELAITPAGDAIAVWTALVGINARVQAVHYAAATNTWGPVVPVSGVGDDGYLAQIAMAPGGDALAVWTRYDGVDEFVQAARYSTASGTWAAPRTLSAGSVFTEYAVVVVGPTGNGLAVWYRLGAAEAARYDAADDTWTPAETLSSGVINGPPALAIDPEGNAVAAWQLSSSGALEVGRYAADTNAWTTAVVPGSIAVSAPAVVLDPAGNAIAVWRSYSAAGSLTQAARYVRATATWTPATFLTTTGWTFGHQLAADATGNVIAVWVGSQGTDDLIWSTRWSAAPAAPVITSIVADTAVVAIHVTPPITREPAFAPTGYEYSVGAGDWVTAPLASPLTITGIRVGPQVVALRAVNHAGRGEYTSRAFEVLPDPPSGLVATAIIGNTVTLSWTPPPTATVETRYVLEGGVLPGQVLASLPTGSAAPSFTFTAPTGTFYVRILATYFQLRSRPSNEIRIAVNVPAVPSAPANLLGLVQGPAIALSWTNTFTGGTPTAMRVDVTGALTGSIPMPTGETFGFPAVPPGTYTLRVVATNASGASAPSNPVTLTFPGACSGLPGVPTRLVATKAGSTISVTWSPPETGAAVTSYRLLVSGAWAGTIPTTARALAGTVGPGTYALRVVAVNPCGSGAPTEAVAIQIP